MKREELTKTFCDDSKLKTPLVSIVCIHILKLLKVLRGTGMIDSSGTFCPHLGRVIRDLSRLLDAVYGIVREH